MKFFIKYSILFFFINVKFSIAKIPNTSTCSSTESEEEECPPNEEFSECGNHECLNTCAEPDRITYCDPVPGCYPGCVCVEGYLRNDEGLCVPISECEPVCEINEEYQTCGTACPDTCENMYDKNRICTLQCVAGCFCEKGYVRNNKGICVLPSECPMKCIANEVFNECGTACPKTCENKDKIIVCTKNCVRGCFCVKGYVRDKNNKCIKESQCPKNCGANEEYSECGANGCQNTCENPTFSHVCKGPCIAGCICKQGYLKNSKGKCVLPEQCGSGCKANEEYSQCGANGCQNTCENPTLSHVCKGPCIAGCICKEGYLRNSEGECVMPKQCYNSCKKPYEVFSKCGNHGCQNTCEEPNLLARCSFVAGCYPGCICKKGYLRNKAGACVPENKCRPKKETTTSKQKK